MTPPAPRTIALIAAGLLCATSLTACTAPEGEATPTPDETVYITPSKEKLFQQAAQMYREYFAEMNDLAKTGGAKEIPDSLKKYVTGDLEESKLGTLRWYEAHDMTTWGRPRRIISIDQSDKTREDSVVSIRVCIRGTDGGLQVKHGKKDINWLNGYDVVYFKYFDGELKAFDSSWAEVSEC